MSLMRQWWMGVLCGFLIIKSLLICRKNLNRKSLQHLLITNVWGVMVWMISAIFMFVSR